VLTFRRPSRAVFRAATAFVALTIASALPFSSVPAGADTTSQLRDAESKLNGLINDVAAAARQRDALQGQLNVLAGKISDTQASIEKTQGQIVHAQQVIQRLEVEIGQRQGVLDTRAKLAYESGPASNLEFFLGASNLADLQERIEIVGAAARSDRSLIDGMTETRNQVHNTEKQLEGLKAEYESKAAQLQGEQHAVDAKFQQQQALVSRLNADQAAAQSLVSKLKAQRRREILAALAAARRRQQQQSAGGGGGGGGSGGGNWVPGIIKRCPVAGPHAYSDSFGAPRYSGGYHPHAGNDIMSPRGTPIVAPFDGRAVAGSNGLGGMSVVVYGSQGYVYNAHLESYGHTGSVTAGTVIGYVGNTGDAQGGPTHDHFEWHPNAIPQNPWRSPYGYNVIGSAVDPYPYLNAVC
jgi:peptidoglycan hydrolase CwlO-like protein